MAHALSKACAGASMVLFVGCGGAAKQPPEPEAAKKASTQSSPKTKLDIKAMLAREASGLQEIEATGPGNAWTARILAAAPPKVMDAQGVGMVEIPIGGLAPIFCQVFAEDLDAASTMGQVLETAMQNSELKAVAPWNITVLDETPTAFVDVLYHVNTPRGKGLGELKVALHPAPRNPVVCMHDALGYKQTFERVTASFVSSIESAGTQPDTPGYVEVQTAKIAEQLVGFQKQFSEKEGSETKLTTMSSLILQTAPSDLKLIDNYAFEVIDRNGRISRATSAEAHAGQINLNVTIERKKGGTYRYRGVVDGKPVHGEFKVRDAQGLPSRLSIAKRLARESGKGSFSFKAPSFMPDVDPTKPVEVTYSRGKDEAARTVHLEAVGMKLSGQIDDHGFFEALEMPLGSATLTLHRAFVRGKI